MARASLLGHDQPLCASYDLAMLDLDGVVYVGERAVEGAPEVLSEVAGTGTRIAFITNNAARTPAQVAEHLRDLGIRAESDDVVTSAQAAAAVLLERFGPAARIACLGAGGLEWAVSEAGLRVVMPGEDAVALVSGYGPDVVWKTIMQAAVSVREGLPWVASNTDTTIPTRFGTAPGHGALVRLISEFAQVRPVVAGKPARPLLDETRRRVGGERPLMIGDRLDTDIQGGHNAGVDTLLVLTGVTDLAQLAAAGAGERPTYLSRGLSGLLSPHPAPVRDGDGWRVGGWNGSVCGGRLVVDGDGDGDDWWRAAACAAWAYADAGGAIAETDRTGIPDVAAVPR